MEAMILSPQFGVSKYMVGGPSFCTDQFVSGCLDSGADGCAAERQAMPSLASGSYTEKAHHIILSPQSPLGSETIELFPAGFQLSVAISPGFSGTLDH